LTTFRLSRALLPGLLLVAAFIAAVILTHNLFTSRVPGMNDFLSRWEGARSFFVDGLSPYSDEASLNIQQRIYGRPVINNEDPGFFVYPFYTAFVMWPMVFMEYAWASAVWLVFLQACLLAALALILNLYRWRPAPPLLAALLLWALFDYFAARGLLLGQPSHLVYLLQVVAVWGLVKQRDSLAGAALALSTLKPQMGYLIVPLLLLWALRERRLRFVGAFALSFGGLMLASFIAQPDWLGDWVAQVRLYPQYTAAAYPDTGSPAWILTVGMFGLDLEWLLTLAFALPMLWGWYTLLVQRQQASWLWVVLLTLVVTHLIAARTATPHFVVFNLAIVAYLQQAQRRLGSAAVVALLAAMTIFHWAQFALTIQGRGNLEHPSLFLPLPLAMFALLLLTRRWWWERGVQPLTTGSNTRQPLP
jgi:hypothetical protein